MARPLTIFTTPDQYHPFDWHYCVHIILALSLSGINNSQVCHPMNVKIFADPTTFSVNMSESSRTFLFHDIALPASQAICGVSPPHYIVLKSRQQRDIFTPYISFVPAADQPPNASQDEYSIINKFLGESCRLVVYST